MITKEVVINNQVGLHARPATFFIQKANEFKSSIWVEKEENVIFGGRLAEYKYYDMDDVIKSALEQAARE